MRLLHYGEDGDLQLTRDLVGDEVPPYAILSHTWHEDEVTYQDFINDVGKSKKGYEKLVFCAQRALSDDLHHWWIDTCCIDKTSSAELSEAINSMFKWYKNSIVCYVYLSDVSGTISAPTDVEFAKSRWFTRGWTLQELLAPVSVQFYTRDNIHLGSKTSLRNQLAEITGIPTEALGANDLTRFGVDERFRWAQGRITKREEDEAYSLLGIFDVQMPLLYGEERTRAKRRLRKAIEEARVENVGPKTGGNVHWVVSKCANSLFTGRSELITRIQDAFHPDRETIKTEQKRLVIIGMGGLGKSEVCIRAANLLREDFWGVFWVDVASEASARNGFMAIAKALKSLVETTEEILHMLASMTDRWLLILDNADDHQVDYATYFPSGNRGAIIMTSRVPECRQYSTITPELLQTLDPKHSTQLLLKAAQVPEASWSTHTAHAEEIVDLLASHTLALIQAGAYIAGGYCSLHQYPERFLQQRKHLLEHYPHQQRSRYRNVYATFEASIDVLMHSDGEAGKDALSLLTILSMLHTSALPTQLFQDTWADARQLLYYGSSVRDVPQHTHKPQRSRRFKFNWGRSKHVNPSPELEKTYDVAQEHISRLPGFLGLELQEWNDSRLMKASALLISLSLVTHEVSNDSDGLSMHPLAHAWAKDRMGKQEQQDAWIQAACLCMLSLLTSKLWHTHKTELRPHMQALTSPQPEILFAYGPKSFMLPIMVQCGWCLLSVGEYRGLQTLLEGIYQYLGVTPWSLPKEQTHLWRLAATASVYSRHTKLAVFLFEHITKVDETSVAPRHPSRLRSRFDLARAYTDNGESERAIILLEDLIVTCRTWSNQDLLLISQIELTRAYNITGQSKKAAELLEPVVKEQNIVGCKESQHAKLRSQHGLSVAYIGNGQLKDAIALLEHVVTSYEAMLDEKHDDRIVSQYDLARAYKEDGQFEKALALIKYVVRIQETTPGQNQHSLAMSRYVLGSTYIACGGYKKQAVQTMEQVVKSHGAMLDETQSELLSAQYGLALAYVDDRRPEAALSIMQHVVRVRKRTLDSTHPHRLQSERLLAELEAGTVYD